MKKKLLLLLLILPSTGFSQHIRFGLNGITGLSGSRVQSSTVFKSTLSYLGFGFGGQIQYGIGKNWRIQAGVNHYSVKAGLRYRQPPARFFIHPALSDVSLMDISVGGLYDFAFAEDILHICPEVSILLFPGAEQSMGGMTGGWDNGAGDVRIHGFLSYQKPSISLGSSAGIFLECNPGAGISLRVGGKYMRAFSPWGTGTFTYTVDQQTIESVSFDFRPRSLLFSAGLQYRPGWRKTLDK